MMRRTKDNWAVVRLHYSADPTMSGARLAAERRRYTSQAHWNMEMEIRPDALSGQRIYPEFDTAIHVIPDEDVPKRMVRYMSIDPHPRTPHAMLWVGVDRWSDIYAYREFWPSIAYGKSITVKDSDQEETYFVKDYAEFIALAERNKLDFRCENTKLESARYIRKEGGEKIFRRYMDQAGKAFNASGEDEGPESYCKRYRRYGIQCSDPYKVHRAGMDAIRGLLTPRKHEVRGMWPRFHVARSCSELILEFLKYRYKQTKRWNDERELYQSPVEARCHMLDNLRYLSTAGIGWVKGYES
jgi:hypothetical protein